MNNKDLITQGDRLIYRIEGETNTFSIEWHVVLFIVRVLVRLLHIHHKGE